MDAREIPHELLTISFIESKVATRFNISDCWNWGTDKTKYGRLWLSGRGYGAHRVIYEMVYGKTHERNDIDHLCRNKNCVNPKHLEEVPHWVNVMRGDIPKIANQRTHCKQGHELTEDNVYRYGKYKTNRMCLICNRKSKRSVWRKKNGWSEEKIANTPNQKDIKGLRCNKGHEKKGENAYEYWKDGVKYKACRICRNANYRKRKKSV